MKMSNSAKAIVYFNKWMDPPLFKSKFNIFNSGIVPIEHYQRDKKFFHSVHPNYLRLDIGWGSEWMEWSKNMVTGSGSTINIDFHDMDELIEILLSTRCRPYFSYCYMPNPLQQRLGEWKRAPKDINGWADLLAKVVKHYYDMYGPGVVIHEIYNEPDNPDFFIDNIDSYLKMYQFSSLSIRKVDPDAVIGGPSLAFSVNWIDPFLQFVEKNKLPLDFFSFHFYGKRGYGNLTLKDLITSIRNILSKYSISETLELHLNEFNSYEIDYPKGGKQEKYQAAADLLDDFSMLLHENDLTNVHWAQFLDSGKGNYSGMISEEGFPKAVYNAYEIYTRLPVERKLISITDNEIIDGMAGEDGDRAGTVFWNKSLNEIEVDISLDSIIDKDKLYIYRIDSNHSSWGDKTEEIFLEPTEIYSIDKANHFEWKGKIPPKGTIYFELSKKTCTNTIIKPLQGQIIRILHYFPNRGSSSYAEFESSSWKAYLGTGLNAGCEAQIACIIDNLPDNFFIDFSLDNISRDCEVDSIIGFRIDYKGKDGFVKSNLYLIQGEKFIKTYKNPWGLKDIIDEIFIIKNDKNVPVNLKINAPKDWNGRVIISFILIYRGSFGRACFYMHQ